MTAPTNVLRPEDIELLKLVRVTTNIEQACADGRITEHDRDERIARAEQWTANRLAWITGSPRPKQRRRFPLDEETS